MYEISTNTNNIKKSILNERQEHKLNIRKSNIKSNLKKQKLEIISKIVNLNSKNTDNPAEFVLLLIDKYHISEFIKEIDYNDKENVFKKQVLLENNYENLNLFYNELIVVFNSRLVLKNNSNLILLFRLLIPLSTIQIIYNTNNKHYSKSKPIIDFLVRVSSFSEGNFNYGFCDILSNKNIISELYSSLSIYIDDYSVYNNQYSKDLLFLIDNSLWLFGNIVTENEYINDKFLSSISFISCHEIINKVIRLNDDFLENSSFFLGNLYSSCGMNVHISNEDYYLYCKGTSSFIISIYQKYLEVYLKESCEEMKETNNKFNSTSGINNITSNDVEYVENIDIISKNLIDGCIKFIYYITHRNYSIPTVFIDYNSILIYIESIINHEYIIKEASLSYSYIENIIKILNNLLINCFIKENDMTEPELDKSLKKEISIEIIEKYKLVNRLYDYINSLLNTTKNNKYIVKANEDTNEDINKKEKDFPDKNNCYSSTLILSLISDLCKFFINLVSSLSDSYLIDNSLFTSMILSFCGDVYKYEKSIQISSLVMEIFSMLVDKSTFISDLIIKNTVYFEFLFDDYAFNILNEGVDQYNSFSSKGNLYEKEVFIYIQCWVGLVYKILYRFYNYKASDPIKNYINKGDFVDFIKEFQYFDNDISSKAISILSEYFPEYD